MNFVNLRVIPLFFPAHRLSLPTTKDWSSEQSPRAEWPFAHGPSTRTHASLPRRYLTASQPIYLFTGTFFSTEAKTMCDHGRRSFESCPKVALKVGCPTDDKMAACLKMTDPMKLTMAGTLNLAGSPDRKDYTAHRIFVSDAQHFLFFHVC